MKYGMMTVIREVGRDYKSNAFVLCKCDCGCEKVVRLGSLKRGLIKSCGCYGRRLASERMKNNKLGATHGLSKTRLYRIWQAMKARCTNCKNDRFKDYGGRGIKICDEWLGSFEVFRDWATSHGYSDKLTIDRIDVNGNYTPENCRWITNDEQQNNKRNNHLVNYKGRTYTLTQLSRKLNIPDSTLWYKLKRGYF